MQRSRDSCTTLLAVARRTNEMDLQAKTRRSGRNLQRACGRNFAWRRSCWSNHSLQLHARWLVGADIASKKSTIGKLVHGLDTLLLRPRLASGGRGKGGGSPPAKASRVLVEEACRIHGHQDRVDDRHCAWLNPPCFCPVQMHAQWQSELQAVREEFPSKAKRHAVAPLCQILP